MFMDINYLRKVAELNLCESCYDKYLSILEPSIESWILNPLADWRTVEMCITQMLMKSKGVFKSDIRLISIDYDSNALADTVDLKRFRELKRWGFKRKINYLNKHGILPSPVHIFLCNVSYIRNNIHDYIHKFSEQDLLLFKQASELAFLIFQAYVLNPPKELETSLRADAEKYADKLLNELDWEVT